MALITVLEIMTHLVTIIGLPLAILAFLYEHRKTRQNDEIAIYQMLSDGYVDFLKLTLRHPDLQLQSNEPAYGLNEEQTKRMLSMFSILISLFERAYLIAYEEGMSPQQERQWRTWDHYMREWCRREDFRTALPSLLSGEDPEFASYITRIAAEEQATRESALSLGKP